MLEENLLSKVKKEYEYWWNYIDQKRTKRREDFWLYIQEAQKDKINTNSVYVAVQTLMSIYWQNKIVVKWQGRDRFDREIALNTNKIAKFDYKEMWIEELDYVLEFNRFIYWVWVQISDWFDFTSIVPKIKNISPLSCIPDPQWWATIKTHRFFWFEANLTEDDMKEMWFKNTDTLNWLSTDEELNVQEVNDTRWYWDDIDNTDSALNTAYFHFHRIGKTPYLTVTNPWCTKLLKHIELLPVTEEEKKDSSKILYPIWLKYYSYVPWDFFSISVPDLLWDKQTVYWKLFNAMISMAIRNAYWDDRFVDVKKIKDIKWLQQPTLEGKIIPVALNPWESINNAVYQLAKDNPWNVPFNVKSYIEEISQLEIWIDRNTSWVLSTQNSTLWEREMAQRNANIRFMLSTKQWNWFEEFRWSYLWYRMYLANFKSTDKKLVFFNTSYSQTTYAFQKDDFIGRWDLRIELINKAEKEQEIQAKKADRMALLPQLIAWAKTDTERVQLYRELLESQWEDEDYIMALFPLTDQEIKAYDKLSAINEDDIDGAIIEDINEDHNTFIKIFQTAEDNSTKRAALQARYDALAYANSMMQQPIQNEAEKSAQNVSSSQLTANSIQQNKWVASLQDITA